MIIDKADPPPRYLPPSSSKMSFSTLPPHILLHIIYRTFPQTTGLNSIERLRKTQYWLSTNLRLVNRAFYIACMHVLRSTYLPHYLALVRTPYTSDPFPAQSDVLSTTPTPSFSPGGTQTTTYTSPLLSSQRESAVLDLFIALKVREDAWADDTELHLERSESFKDLFDYNQPRSRLEDLVRIYGIRDSVITLQPVTPLSPSATSPRPIATLPSSMKTQSPPPRSFTQSLFSFISSSPKPSAPPAAKSASKPKSVTPIPFSLISISFTLRKVGLVLTTAQGKRTIIELQRSREDKLEATAHTLVSQLRMWLNDGGRI
ncbi:hypothetical protein AMATHDRAFT_61786 [Amanita thiersii Skay4041]|uniref:F-box domain-containing protein n=1 Tax=Amanita thiersii Skay4041 TaxID=703135 RepID=A0A2A9NGJ5_9AGAR|nr:hypothetical protein AMATHDRAFT_61786 [Amanita thiersii Skay4041]